MAGIGSVLEPDACCAVNSKNSDILQKKEKWYRHISTQKHRHGGAFVFVNQNSKTSSDIDALEVGESPQCFIEVVSFLMGNTLFNLDVHSPCARGALLFS